MSTCECGRNKRTDREYCHICVNGERATPGYIERARRRRAGMCFRCDDPAEVYVTAGGKTMNLCRACRKERQRGYDRKRAEIVQQNAIIVQRKRRGNGV